MYDLILKGGRVVDPAAGVDALLDVAITGGKIAAVDSLTAAAAHQIVDVTGLMVTPGLIDMHVHVYPGVSPFGIDPDSTCLARGVTTVVDAGSAGAMIFQGFRHYVVERAKTRILAFLHLISIGLTRSPMEIHDLEYADVDACVQTIQANPDLLLGVKLRFNPPIVEKLGLEPLRLARQAADRAGLPLMLHGYSTPEYFTEMLSLLKGGDIFTHCFGRRHPPLVDERGQVRAEVQAALDRGVYFDVGHGKGSFDFLASEAALAAGLDPYSISTDLHVFSLPDPVPDFCDVLSKYLLLGMPLYEVIRRATANPAVLIGRPDLGVLKVDTVADLAVLELQTGDFKFVDALGATRQGRQKLVPRLVIKDGQRLQVGLIPH